MNRRKAKKTGARVETWKGKRVRVSRSSNGRFASWHKIRPYRHRQAARHWASASQSRQYALIQGQKRVAAYGTTRNWKGRIKRNRIEIVGSGRALYNAVVMMFDGYVPREPYTVVRAEDVGLEDFERGDWIEGPEIESR